MIQQSCIFNGDASENPHSHLIDFLELVETAKYNGVPPEPIKLRLFPFSLKGDAKTWLRSLPQGSITTWDHMIQKFLNKYFSSAKTTKLRQDISNFLQTDTKSVYQAWEKLKAMLRKCPHHDIPEHMQLYIFYHGLKPSSRNVIDVAAGGSVMGKTTEEALQLLNEISENAIQWPSESVIIKKAATVNTQQPSQSEGPPGYQNPNHGQSNFRPYQQATPYQQRPQQAHLSQLAALITEKIQGRLPSNTEKNSKEHLKAITLWSGKELNEPYTDQSEQQVNNGKNVEIPIEPYEKKEVKKKILNPLPVTISFPQKMKRKTLDSQFAKFLKILKQININVPAILQNKLPQKLGDPCSFTIPCTLGGVYFEKALCDSGASINLMQFSIFRKLNLGEMKDICVSLQFADQSTKKPKGIIENVFVRVYKFVFPVDFIVLEMKECPNEPIILGRPLLATGRAIIDAHQGQLILRVHEERVIFDMQKILRFSGDETSSSCFSIYMLNYLTDEFKDDQLIPDSMERCLAKSGTKQDNDLIIRREAEILEKDSEDEEIQPEQANSPAPKEIESSNAGSSKKEIVKLLAAGYNQIPIAPEDQDKITFTCPHGTYAYRRMSFRLCNAPATFQRCMSAIFSDMTEKFLEICMDDFTLFGLPPLTTVKGIRSFLGHTGDCLKAFETLKEKLSTARVVVSPDWNQPFEVMCDASDIAIGAVFGQRKDKIFRPIYYVSRTMNEAQLNYATTEKELLAVVFAFDKFRSYLIGTKVTIFTDHAALKYLLAKKDDRPRLLRWILLLQEYDLEIKDKKGTENQVADHLSRLENPLLEFSEIKEEFPDEHIFSVNSIVTQPPWFADIANYLVGKRTPQDLSYQ
ncbi:uncharacterized protein LOC142177601 [Nicotiana tabacum]|uniref:Uncharacterized protein LOC142177601 n=1 Tax=Nicotiana tabacum TaxID=4097 RepID=A0AC58U0A8_TOBAC